MKFTSTASVCILVSAVQHLVGFATASPIAQFPSDDLPSYPGLDSADASDAPASVPGDYPPSITLPYRGDGKELPQPPAGMTLKAVAVGAGEQQYMCKGQKKPAFYGAIAELYDSSAVFESGTSPTDFTSSMLEYRGRLPLRRVGRHYFDGRGSPAFILDGQGFFRGMKQASVDAPKDPNHNRGAIQWLQMTDKGDSQVFKMAYRVATAGGTAPTSCRQNNRVEHIPYAALYYFYG